jgi:2-polyprenyl-3-methyl-5-hydroxy-6-metoxy-1,4-benzoquinol methylase
MAIPKIIHQTYFSEDALPPEIVKNIEYLKKNNPEWEYRFYDDKDVLEFISKNYPSEILNLFNKINPNYGAAKADLFRYLLMYKVGGVYLDIKSTSKNPLDKIITREDSFLISQWRNQLGFRFSSWGLHKELINVPGGEFNNWIIISEARHPFLLNVIKRVLYNIKNYNIEKDGVGGDGTLRLTGPIPYTLSIVELLKDNKYRFFSAEDSGFLYSIYPNNDHHIKSLHSNYKIRTDPIIQNNIKHTFEEIYRNKLWGNSGNEVFYSGYGSHDLGVADVYKDSIIKVLSSYQKKLNAVDVGCGDFNIGKMIRPMCELYTAIDIVNPLIEFNKIKYKSLNVDFLCLDITKDEIPSGDIIFIRQVFQHLSNKSIKNCLSQVTKKFKYIVFTDSQPNIEKFIPNLDIIEGAGTRTSFGSGVVLTAPPFNLVVQKEIVLCEVPEYSKEYGSIKTLFYEL